MSENVTTRLVKLTASLMITFLCGCGPQSSNEWKKQDEKLSRMLASKATREQIETELGRTFYYQKGVTNWEHLEAFLSGDRRTDIREQMGDSTRVLYHTTANLMTWVFLDDNERIKNYYLCGQ